MSNSLPELTIEAGRGERHYWQDLWRYRELLYFLAWRDVKVRYKQTLVGVAWVVVRPLLMMAVLTLVFHRIAGMREASGVPYALMVLAGLLPWQFFSATLAESGNSLVGNAQIISKIYFPRILVPISTLVAGLVDFAVTLLLLIPLMAWYGQWPDWTLLLLPAMALVGALVTLGVGISLAALNVQYRDVRFVIPFIVQFGLYVTPVGFRAGEVPDDWRWLFDLNPMVGVVEGFRWCLLGGYPPPSTTALLGSVTVGVVMFAFGVRHFRRVENTFADVI
ncbi:MAG: ABC transporter permease [Gammaproteobacteria bacterium]|nr:ABC transporter permease [Gammaproteobacteria bacterium]